MKCFFLKFRLFILVSIFLSHCLSTAGDKNEVSLSDCLEIPNEFSAFIESALLCAREKNLDCNAILMCRDYHKQKRYFDPQILSSALPELLEYVFRDEVLQKFKKGTLSNELLEELRKNSQLLVPLFNGAKLVEENASLYEDLQLLISQLSENLDSLFQNSKAPRPNSPAVTASNAVVGKNTCDLTQVLSLLSIIKKNIELLKKLICDKFNGTFTVLQNIEIDFSGVFTVLADLDISVTIGELTVSVLVDLSGVFTSLENICEKIEGTFTVLEEIQEDIFDTKTILCDKFNGTFTVLQEIELDISGVFTVLQDLQSTLTEDIFDTRTIVCDKFLQTWTILSEIENNIGCKSTSITQTDVNDGGGTYIITASGNYSLAEDITSAFAGGSLMAIIQIASSNVTLDLCGRKITGDITSLTNGILVEPNLSNVRIENGTVEMVGLAGVFVRSGACDIWLENLTTTSAVFGFRLNDLSFMDTDLVSNVFINQCQGINCTSINTKSYATRFVLIPSGGLSMRRCRSITVRNSNFSENIGTSFGAVVSIDVFGTQMDTCSNCFFKCCTMNNNWGDQSGTGLSVFSCTNNIFENCTFNGNRKLGASVFVGGGFGVFMNTSFNNVFKNCVANQNAGNLAGIGFRSFQGNNNIFVNCVASDNNGPGGGFIFENESCSSFKECQSLSNTATVLAGDDCAGFMSRSGRNNLIENCQALGTTADDVAAGFLFGGETVSSIINCLSQTSSSLTGTGFGILLDLEDTVTCISCFVKNNCVITTTGIIDSFGYQDSGSPNSSSLFTGNFAFNNGTNYSVVYPSGPLPVVSGSISGGLPATGTSGIFDNISIDA